MQRSDPGTTAAADGGAGSSSPRLDLILDAAESCFVRAGFHRTTMQDVAGEAGMSAGNLYRYFSSKDALIEGLVERDRSEMSRCFSEVAGAGNLLQGLRDLGAKYFKEEPRAKAVFTLQIWAEATRSERLAEITAAFERELITRMEELISAIVAQSPARGRVDAHAVTVLVTTLSNGLFVRRALMPDFDADREVDAVLSLIAALIAGDIAIPGISRTLEQTP